MNTLEDCLRHHAAVHPGTIALTCGNVSVTYGKLHDMVCREALSLGELNGRLVPLIATSSASFLVSYLAVHLAGGVAVPLDKDTSPEQLSQHTASFAGKTAPQDVADVLFTTGTTGKSKGVMVSQRAIMANAENLAEAQQFDSNLTFVVCGPLNHIGSLSKLFPSMLVGAAVSIVDGLKNMPAFFSTVANAPVKAATFLVPASIRMLIAFARHELAAQASKIDFIETGAAPMPLADMQQLCSLLPHSRLYNTYASTETGIISTFDYNAGECLAGCLGKPMRHSSIEITPDGRVACSGKTLMSGYWGDEQLTRSVMHDGTVFTADMGHLDSCGRLRLSGRNDDVINVGGYKVSPIEVEDAAMGFPGVSDCVCIAAEHPVVGTALKLLVVADHAVDRRLLSKHLHSKLASHKCPNFIEQVDAIRRTFNGKIDRKSYRNPS